MANTRIRADLIQIGDSIKPVSLTQYTVVEAVAEKGGDYPYRLFLLADGSTHKAFDGALIWWRQAAFAA